MASRGTRMKRRISYLVGSTNVRIISRWIRKIKGWAVLREWGIKTKEKITINLGPWKGGENILKMNGNINNSRKSKAPRGIAANQKIKITFKSTFRKSSTAAATIWAPKVLRVILSDLHAPAKGSWPRKLQLLIYWFSRRRKSLLRKSLRSRSRASWRKKLWIHLFKLSKP